MFCPQCANKIPLQNQKFCDSCGFDLSKVVKENVSQTNEKHAAAVQQSVSISPKKAGVKKNRYWIAYVVLAAMVIGIPTILTIVKNSLNETEGTRNNATDWYESANAKSHLKEYRGAIADYTKAIALRSGYADAYYNRGNAKFQLADYQGAIADYTRTIELNPNAALAFFSRANTKVQLADCQGAIADYTKTIGLMPGYADAYYDRGLAYGTLGLYDKALADFSRAIELGHPVPQNILDMCK